MPPAVARAAQRGQEAKPETVQFRRWKGLNLEDSRVAIDDEELAWLENALIIGRGSIQILPAPGPSIATIPQGAATLWGLVLNGTPVVLTVNADGSMTQVAIPGGATTVVCGAGTVTTAAHVTIWQGSPALVIDPTQGYFSWDGTTFTTISTGVRGQSIAVFEGRTWIGNNRTIQYSAPNSFSNFNAPSGGGSSIITDEQFQGNIVALYSALEELWIVGNSAIDALSNVTATELTDTTVTPPVTTVTTAFSITNITSNLGSHFPASVIGYFRALAFMSATGAYALSGVTPQKLSDKLDDLFQSLQLAPDVPAAVASVRNLNALLFLVTYVGTNMQQGVSPQPMVLGFVKGQWFLAGQGVSLKWLTTVIAQDGTPQAWGTDGTHLVQLFGASATTPVTYKVQSRLLDFGLATTAKAVTKAGIEFQSSSPIAPLFTIDSEAASGVPVPIAVGNVITWVNAMGQVIGWLNDAGALITWTSGATLLTRQNVPQFGHYLGWTLSGNDPPFRLQAVQLEVTKTRQWSHP